MPRYCSACGGITGWNYCNPLLGVPLCITCYDIYMNDEYPLDEDGKNEIFCRWCGEGEGEIMLCDSCPKSFCSRCIRLNFGEAEVQRITNLPDRWSCFVCSPQLLRDLFIKKGWNKEDKSVKKARMKAAPPPPPPRPGLIYQDVSKGRERIEIPVINEVDNAPPPLDFVYISQPVAGEGFKLTNNPNFLSCCSCTDNCRDAEKCECILNSGGISYDIHGRLMRDKPAGIYECNDLCSCNVNRCKNRVVGRGPNQRLEVFRCADPLKGWGVRCRDDILPGTFIAEYVGEYLLEADAETRGLAVCDEYLYSMDCWGRSQACLKLHELGLKEGVTSIPREYYINCTTTTAAQLARYFDPSIVELLVRSGAVDRALKQGRAVTHPTPSTDAATTAGSGCQILCQEIKKVRKSKSSANSKAVAASSLSSQVPVASAGESKGEVEATSATWFDLHKAARKTIWDQARSLIMDRSMMEVDEAGDLFVIDARYVFTAL
jgi:hypothetical protein